MEIGELYLAPDGSKRVIMSIEGDMVHYRLKMSGAPGEAPLEEALSWVLMSLLGEDFF